MIKTKTFVLLCFIFACLISLIECKSKADIIKDSEGTSLFSAVAILSDGCALSSTVVEFQAGNRYQLQLQGLSTEGRFLESPGFFGASAVTLVTTRDLTYQVPTLIGILNKRQSGDTPVVVSFIPTVVGTYPIYCRAKGATSPGKLVGSWKIVGDKGSSTIEVGDEQMRGDSIRSDQRNNVLDASWQIVKDDSIEVSSSPLSFSPNDLNIAKNVPYNMLLTRKSSSSGPLTLDASSIWKQSIFLRIEETFSSLRAPYIERVTFNNGRQGRVNMIFTAVTSGEFSGTLSQGSDSINVPLSNNSNNVSSVTPPTFNEVQCSVEGAFQCSLGQNVCCPSGSTCCFSSNGTASACAVPGVSSCCGNQGAACGVNQKCCAHQCISKDDLCCGNDEIGIWTCASENRFCGAAPKTCSASIIASSLFLLFITVLFSVFYF